FVYNDNPAFDFRTLGVRVPTIVVSPWVGPTVDDTAYDHTSVIATLLDLFAPEEDRLTARVTQAKGFHHLIGRADTSRSLPDLPAAAPNDDGWFAPEAVEEPTPRLTKVTVGDGMSEQLGGLASQVDDRLRAKGV